MLVAVCSDFIFLRTCRIVYILYAKKEKAGVDNNALKQGENDVG